MTERMEGRGAERCWSWPGWDADVKEWTDGCTLIRHGGRQAGRRRGWGEAEESVWGGARAEA